MSIEAGITGTRAGMTRKQKGTFEAILNGLFEPLEIHLGCCIGVDEEIVHILANYPDISVVGHPPINTKYRMTNLKLLDKVLPARSYLQRDMDIVDATESLLVIPRTEKPEPRSGTWYTYNYAKDVKKPISIIYPDGRFVDD